MGMPKAHLFVGLVPGAEGPRRPKEAVLVSAHGEHVQMSIPRTDPAVTGSGVHSDPPPRTVCHRRHAEAAATGVPSMVMGSRPRTGVPDPRGRFRCARCQPGVS